ncbi:MFS transporter [Marinobacterium iners]|uniref:MFS transporter n=1 Tax=Marinobacterium iners TaxID=48076 RepID=UPI001A906D67|nr:MFS transporter [Marinobacterium iners]QSR34374.1 MFS transporter [Marinobacterium iners]
MKAARLGSQQLFTYALPALPLAVPTVGLYVLLPTWYVEQGGLALWLVGLILMLARASDLITDPLIGYWLDRGRPVRYRQFILAGAVLCLPGLALLVLPPAGHAVLSLLLGSTLLYLGWTLVQVPYLSWLAALSPESYQRARAASLREGFGLIGLLLSAVLPAAGLMLALSTQQVLWLIAGFTLLPGAWALWRLLHCLELPAQEMSNRSGSDWKSLWRNRTARMLLQSWFWNGIANGVPAVLFPLYVTRTLAGSEADRGLLILVYFGAAVLSLPLWLGLSRLFDKADLWRGAMLFAICAFLPASWLGAGDLYWFMLVCVLTGLALGADLALPHALQAEVCDWDRFRYRRQRRGLLFACWNGANKLALALAALIGFGLLNLADGFVPEYSDVLLAILYAGIPCVMKLIAIWRLRHYPLRTRLHARLMQRIQLSLPK